MTIGRVHSIESMGLVDGPGIRTVVFFQGCKLRCAYCHNPDTWQVNEGAEYTPEELVSKIKRFKPYFERSNGGVTFSGGDPLMQPEFLVECLKLCKENGIHTCIDTSGYGFGEYDEILKYADLVLLDIKHIDSIGYKELTGQDAKGINTFLDAIRTSQTPVWVRHVVVPGMTDSKDHIQKISAIVNEEIPTAEKVELLPYHNLGTNKYQRLNMKYKLDGIEPMCKNKVQELQGIVNNLVKNTSKQFLGV